MNKALKERSMLFQALKMAASRAFYHAGRGSVSHTRTSVNKVVELSAEAMQLLETERTYSKRFETAIMQAQDGPVEVQISGDTILIAGNFKIADLRQFLIVNSPSEIITIPVMGSEK